MVRNKPSLLLGNNNPSKRSFQFKILFLIILFTFLIPFLSGCVTLSDPEASQEYNSDTVGSLNLQTTIGQSFVSRRSHLNGISLWLTSSSGQSNVASGPLTNQIAVKLYYSPLDTNPIYSTSITANIGDKYLITVPVPEQNNPAGQSYYLSLSTETGTSQVNGRNEDAYPYGQAYINSVPVNADMAFRLSYDYDLVAFFQDAMIFLRNSWIILPFLILTWLPGWLLLDVSGLRPHFDFGERTATSIGLSLALLPVVLLWTTTLGLKWSAHAVWFFSGGLVALFLVRLVYRYLRSSKTHPKPVSDQVRLETSSIPQGLSSFSHDSLFLLLIFIVTLAVRLIMVRDLATPAWVDAVHHALITQLIVDHGAYPSSYLPYLNISPTAYHAGFHSIAAFFMWLSRLDVARVLLILGQVLNAAAIFSVYLLCKTLTRSSRSALFAAFITGFMTPMPAYYTSWGRYTELTGLLILPVVIAMIQLWFNGKADHKNIWTVILGAIAAAGLFMVHYRVVIFLACLILSFLFFRIIFRNPTDHVKLSRLVVSIFSMTALSIIFVLPWIIPTLKATVFPKLASTSAISVAPFQDFPWAYLTSAFGKQALVLASLGFVLSLIKKRSMPFIIFTWMLMLFFLANVDTLKLPGSGLITNLSVEIILFMPVSILGGYFIDQLLQTWQGVIPSRVNQVTSLVAIIVFGFIGYLGSTQVVAILNPITILSRQADLPAIQWVSEHIPANETIAINPFGWGYGLYAGYDGGYWIEPLSDRLTTPPPVLYGLGSGYKQISLQSQQIISLSANPTQLNDYLNSQGIHYVFVGRRGGVLPPEKLVSSGFFELLYHQDGVWILSVKPVNAK
jgi:hypothetical protein